MTALSSSTTGVRAQWSSSTTMRVRQVRWEADGVVSIELTTTDGAPIPDWEPGAHIDVVLPSGLVRQYSLCGDLDDSTSLTIAVLHEADGRGGSREMHETQLVGTTLEVMGPRNHFALRDAPGYLLIAGGIGITPILSMARSLEKRGAAYKLVYGGRSRKTMAFLGELENLSDVTIVAEDESGLPDLEGLLDEAAPGTEVWCCGPEGLLRAVETAAEKHEIPVHIERFGGARSGSGTDSSTRGADADAAFIVELRRTGITVEVPPDRSLLDVVRDHVPDVTSSCEEGFCGSCETAVLEGEPDHRDVILTAGERAANETMMICVGRSCSQKLVLDL